MARIQEPTQNDWASFYEKGIQEKAEALYRYLYDGGNMEVVASQVYGSTDQSACQNVSEIMRCYGFSGQNSGYFSRRKKYELEFEDFVAFAKAYPKGCKDWPEHSTIDAFMEKRHNARIMARQQKQSNRVSETQSQTHSYEPDRYAESREMKEDRVSTNSSGSGSPGDVGEIIGAFVGFIVVIAIIWFVLDKLGVFKFIASAFAWVANALSVICAFLCIGCILGAVCMPLWVIATKRKLRNYLPTIVAMFVLSAAFAYFTAGWLLQGIVASAVAYGAYKLFELFKR